MKFSHLAFLGVASFSLAQRPTNTTICDYYSSSILGANTAANQKLLMTLLINTVVLGNYTTPNTGISVHGFATPAIYNGTEVALLPYFTPELLSANKGGNVSVGVAFLDDGGAVPLQHNMSSNGNTSSLQYNTVTHIYEYFGALLNCSLQGSPDFPSYQGRTSMYEVHKFMDFSSFAMDFFIKQCIDSALSLGFSPSDANDFYLTLQQFNSLCSPPATVLNIPSPGKETKELQSVCLAPDCKQDPKAECGLYAVAFEPANATLLVLGNGTNGTGTGGWNGTTTGMGGAATQTASGSVGARERIGEAFWTVVLVVVAVIYVKL